MENARSGRLSRVLQGVLVCELVAYTAAATVRVGQGETLGRAVLAMVCIWAAIRGLANAYNFALTWMVRTPRDPPHRLGPLRTLRLFCGEWLAMLVVYSLLFPFERWLVPNAPRRRAEGTPVILVPGFCCNRGYFWRLRRHLESAGLGPVYAVSLEPLLGSIEDNARQLSCFVEQVCAETGCDQVALVGHSMGGLTARSYLHQLDGAHRVARLVTLGTPHHGTVLAEGLAGLAANLREMSRDSAWLQALNRSEQEAAPVPVLAISTPHDDIVGPQRSTQLDPRYARNLLLPGIGHLEMVLSIPVLLAVSTELGAAAMPGADTAPG